MNDSTKKNAQTPKETEQALDQLADRLEEMDKAQGVFGETMAEALPDEYLQEIAGGMLHIIPTSPAKCLVCGHYIDSAKTYYTCPGGKSADACPFVAGGKNNGSR